MPRSRSTRLSRRSPTATDRKSTRLNSSHSQISYAVFCLKKKKPEMQGDGGETMNLFADVLSRLRVLSPFSRPRVLVNVCSGRAWGCLSRPHLLAPDVPPRG